MLNGREKLGSSAIDWAHQASFGAGKMKRKTIKLGGEVFIRELSIIDGGIGAAVWDASIILSRWIMDKKDEFRGKSVLELGAGVGLPGIVAARYAARVVLTDYIEKVNDNIQYNVEVNSKEDEDDRDMDQEWRDGKLNIAKAAEVKLLDWNNINEPGLHPLFPPCEILMGSELTYTGDEVHQRNLVKVIETYMAPNGVMYEILSTDRDGVPVFLRLMDEGGFSNEIQDVDPKYMGKFNTKQRPENYRFYTFRRKSEQAASSSSS